MADVEKEGGEPQEYLSSEKLSQRLRIQYNELERDTDELVRMRTELNSRWDELVPILGLDEPRSLEFVGDEEKRAQVVGHLPTWDDLQGWREAHQLRTIAATKVEESLQKDGIKPGSHEYESSQRARMVSAMRKTVEGLRLRNELVAREGGTTFESEVLRHYDWFRTAELEKGKADLAKNGQKLEDIRLQIADAKRRGDTKEIGRLQRRYRQAFSAREQIIYSSPETFFHQAGQTIAEAKKVFDERGKIVETPYVKAKTARILLSMRGDKSNPPRPVFLHGETGAGKTELAYHLAIKYLSEPHVKRWEKAHPEPKTEIAKKTWREKREMQRQPLVIGGHKGLDVQDILGGTEIKQKEPVAPENRVEIINQEIETFREAHQDASEDAIETLRRAWEESFKTPLETRAYFAAFYKAMQEGRPLIIDEMDAIPHHVLIVLNNLLNKKPGDSVIPQINEAPEFTVQEGFCIIGTGNWDPTGEKLYFGRQDLDAAFLGRFDVIDYDFLPQNDMPDVRGKAVTPEDRQARKENELYHMLLIRMMDSQLGAWMPESAPDQLFQLARLARVFQDVFSHREVGQGYNYTGNIDPRSVLKENVLSLRHLIPIIESWKKDGFVRPLDDYLFLQYVTRSNARPEEKLYLYSALQTQGEFFPISKGWPHGEDRAQASKILRYPIETKMFGCDAVSGEQIPIPESDEATIYHSPLSLIRKMFGEVGRTRFPKGETIERTNVEDALARMKRLRKVEEIKRRMATIRAEDGFTELPDEIRSTVERLAGEEETEE